MCVDDGSGLLSGGGKAGRRPTTHSGAIQATDNNQAVTTNYAPTRPRTHPRASQPQHHPHAHAHPHIHVPGSPSTTHTLTPTHTSTCQAAQQQHPHAHAHPHTHVPGSPAAAAAAAPTPTPKRTCHVGGADVELGPVVVEEGRVPPALLLRQHVQLRLELLERLGRPRRGQHLMNGEVGGGIGAVGIRRGIGKGTACSRRCSSLPLPLCTRIKTHTPPSLPSFTNPSPPPHAFTHLPALHVLALDRAEEAADVVARPAVVQRLLEHLHACGCVGGGLIDWLEAFKAQGGWVGGWVGRIVSCGSIVYQSTNQPINQPTNQSIHHSINR